MKSLVDIVSGLGCLFNLELYLNCKVSLCGCSGLSWWMRNLVIVLIVSMFV